MQTHVCVNNIWLNVPLNYRVKPYFVERYIKDSKYKSLIN